jgi:hypothetical protein
VHLLNIKCVFFNWFLFKLDAEKSELKEINSEVIISHAWINHPLLVCKRSEHPGQWRESSEAVFALVSVVAALE